MAVKRASLRGKGASIFFGGDEDEQVESQELPSSQTEQVENFATSEAQNSAAMEHPDPVIVAEPEHETSRLSESRSRKVSSNQSSEPASSKVAKSQTGRVSEERRATSMGVTNAELSNLQSPRVTDIDTSDDYVFATESLPDAYSRDNPSLPNASSRLSQSSTSQGRNFTRPELSNHQPGSKGNQTNLQSSIVSDSRSARVANRDTESVTHYDSRTVTPARVQAGTSIADETRAEYIVDSDVESYPVAGQMSFSEFYLSGETHYLMLEPLATRITSEQMDRLSTLERRIHQGRRRKEPRVTKNSIIRALLEATFDLQLDTRDINSEMELVNRFREALHLASLVREVRE